jgi:hypothetical protein
MLPFGHDAGGPVGWESLIISDDTDMNKSVVGWTAAITATAILILKWLAECTV